MCVCVFFFLLLLPSSSSSLFLHPPLPAKTSRCSSPTPLSSPALLIERKVCDKVTPRLYGMSNELKGGEEDDGEDDGEEEMEHELLAMSSSVVGAR